MNQKLINAILFAALAILAFLHFKGNSAGISNTSKQDSLSQQVLKVAYVDLDSLQEKYIRRV